MVDKLTRGLWLAIGTALVVLPFIPPTNPLAKGLRWWPQVESWAIGTVVVIVLAALCGWLAARRNASPRWRMPDIRISLAVMTVLLAAGAVWVMRSIFASNPHLVDEMAQLLHARALLEGLPAAPAPNPPDAFLITHTWIADGKWFSQYPPGQTVLFTIGLLLGAEWLVNPLLGAISVVFVYYAGRGLYGPKAGLIAAVLWFVSPWVLFMSGTYMNHVPATTLAIGAWAIFWGPRRARPWHALLAGAALAGVAVTRPLDAVAAALPMGVWLLFRRRWNAIPLMALGGAPLIAAMLYFNWRVYGNPFTLGYDLLYGKEHGLGFHMDPWGDPYTPAVALNNMVLAVQRMNIYLYEWPIPALLPLLIWALAGRQRGWRDLVVAVGLIAAPLLYFFYWHSGFYLGPRFYYIAGPFVAIAMARGWVWAWRRVRRVRAPVRGDVALATAAAVVIVWGWLAIVPERVAIYRTGLATMKQHPERELKAQGVERALVLVPESFGSRVMGALWGLGVLPGQAEVAYRRIDTCDLFLFTRQARAAGWSAAETSSRLAALAASIEVPAPRMESWPDPSLKLRIGSTPPEVCQVELRRDLQGFTLYGYLPWRNDIGNDSGIVFARDLFDRNNELLQHYPGWDVWRYAPPPGRPDTLPVLTRLTAAGGTTTTSSAR